MNPFTFLKFSKAAIRGAWNHPLHSENRFSAIKKIVSWQLIKSHLPGPVLIDFLENKKLLLPPDLNGSHLHIMSSLHEFQPMAFLLHLLQPGNLFLDIGANIGSYTLLAAGVSKARCHSFEPNQKNFYFLEQNIHINNLENQVVAHRVGLGAKEEVAYFTSHFGTTSHVATDLEIRSGQVEEVKICQLDSVEKDLNPTLIKMDVEGFESNVIEGGLKTLNSKSLLALIIELSGEGAQYGFNEVEIHEKLLSLGLEPIEYNPFTRQLTALPKTSLKPGTLIYVRNFHHVANLLQQAKPFIIEGRSI